MAGKERRSSERFNKKNLFYFKMHENGSREDHYLRGLLIDYSLAGIRFITDEPLDKNTPILIELDLDDFSGDTAKWREAWETGEEGSLNVIGSVMWCSETVSDSGIFEVGTRFLEKAPVIL